jgi:hypothetical protein
MRKMRPVGPAGRLRHFRTVVVLVVTRPMRVRLPSSHTSAIGHKRTSIDALLVVFTNNSAQGDHALLAETVRINSYHRGHTCKASARTGILGKLNLQHSRLQAPAMTEAALVEQS